MKSLISPICSIGKYIMGMTVCQHCNNKSVSAGSPCHKSPTGGHVVPNSGDNVCMYCNAATGVYKAGHEWSGCKKSDSGKHISGTKP